MDFSPVIISLKTAVCALLIVFPAGTLLAWQVMNIQRQRLKIVMDSLLTLPLVLPPTVAGLLLLCLFGVNRPLGRFFLDVFGVKIAFSFASTVIASAFVSFPMMYRSARGAFEQVDPHLLDAAQNSWHGGDKNLSAHPAAELHSRAALRQCPGFHQRTRRIWSHSYAGR